MSLRTRPRALVADDDEAMCRVLIQVLARWGFDAEAFADGQALASASLQVAPDLVVTDQHMPLCTGVSAVGHIRAAGAGCPAIVLTAFPDAALVDQVRALGRSALLAKPVDLATLQETILRLGQA